MILVAGSTGLLGSEICRQLAAQQKPVRALVRKTSSPEKINALTQMGCGLAEGDFKDKTSLLRACEGCDVVISTVSSTLSRQEGDNIQTVDHDGNHNLIAAAKESGIKQFIFISFRHQHAMDNPLTEAKRSAEQTLKSCGMKYTILQASIFMEVWLSPALGFNYNEHTAQIPGDGTNPISYVSYKDVAAFAAASVDNPVAENEVLEIGGAEPLVPAQVIKEFENIRKMHPQHFFLVPGVGTQGGSLEEISQKAMTDDCGILVNVSRAIIYASGEKDFAKDARKVAENYHAEMRSYLKR